MTHEERNYFPCSLLYFYEYAFCVIYNQKTISGPKLKVNSSKHWLIFFSFILKPFVRLFLPFVPKLKKKIIYGRQLQLSQFLLKQTNSACCFFFMLKLKRISHLVTSVCIVVNKPLLSVNIMIFLLLYMP